MWPQVLRERLRNMHKRIGKHLDSGLGLYPKVWARFSDRFLPELWGRYTDRCRECYDQGLEPTPETLAAMAKETSGGGEAPP